MMTSTTTTTTAAAAPPLPSVSPQPTPSTPNRNIPPGVRNPSRRNISNPAAGEVVTFVKYSYETNGEYTLAEAICVAGGGPPLHYHRSYEEHFEALEGDLILQVGAEGEEMHLRVGESKTVPRGVLHRFTAGQGGATFRVRVTPGQEEFEKSLYVLFGLARDGEVDEKTALPKSVVQTAVIGSMGDMYFPGGGGFLINGITNVLALYARWSGIQDELLKKYWDV